MRWRVEIDNEFWSEFQELPEDVQTEILALSRVLEQLGPQLGRPRVDTLKGSRHANMKELRFNAADGVWRASRTVEEENVMPRNVNDVIAGLSPARRKKVEARAAELLAEEMTLRELRAAHHKTQVSVAAALGIGQDGVSRLEQRTDLLISTLRSYVEAIGGNLELVARFPDRPAVVIEGLAGMDSARHRRRAQKPPTRARKARENAHSRSL